MKTQNDKTPQLTIVLVVALIATAAVYRVISASPNNALPNFAPVMAMAFCGAFFLPSALAYFVPLAAIVISDILLAITIGYPALSLGAVTGWVCLGFAVLTGQWLARRANHSPGALVGGLLANSFLFYLVTNTASWLGNPAYAKTSAGLVQSLTVGLPGYPPTWMFFRNSLISDLLFAGLIFGVYLLAQKFALPKDASANIALQPRG